MGYSDEMFASSYAKSVVQSIKPHDIKQNQVKHIWSNNLTRELDGNIFLILRYLIKGSFIFFHKTLSYSSICCDCNS